MEEVAQDGEQPGVQVGAGLETVDVLPGPHDRVLDEVVGPVGAVRERDRKGAQARDCGEEGVADVVRNRLRPAALPAQLFEELADALRQPSALEFLVVVGAQHLTEMALDVGPESSRAAVDFEVLHGSSRAVSTGSRPPPRNNPSQAAGFREMDAGEWCRKRDSNPRPHHYE
jgi:hypothetical protein